MYLPITTLSLNKKDAEHFYLVCVNIQVIIN